MRNEQKENLTAVLRKVHPCTIRSHNPMSPLKWRDEYGKTHYANQVEAHVLSVDEELGGFEVFNGSVNDIAKENSLTEPPTEMSDEESTYDRIIELSKDALLDAYETNNSAMVAAIAEIFKAVY